MPLGSSPKLPSTVDEKFTTDVPKLSSCLPKSPKSFSDVNNDDMTPCWGANELVKEAKILPA